MDDDLVRLLAEQRVSCRLWPEQTEGPYHRDVQLERRDITEDRDCEDLTGLLCLAVEPHPAPPTLSGPRACRANPTTRRS